MLVAIHHRKGGVGKTTTAQHLAAAAAKAGIRTLAVDCDGQANLTAAFGVREPTAGIADVLRASMQFEDPDWAGIIVSIGENLDLVPSTSESFRVQDEVAQYDGIRAGLLRAAMLEMSSYPLIVCDTAPSAGWLASNALLAADRIIAPVACETFAVDGLAGLNEALVELGRKNNPDRAPLKVSALVPTMLNGSRAAHRQLLALMRERFDGLVTKTVIRTDANVEAAQNHNTTVFDFAPKSRAADDYVALARELLA